MSTGVVSLRISRDGSVLRQKLSRAEKTVLLTVVGLRDASVLRTCLSDDQGGDGWLDALLTALEISDSATQYPAPLNGGETRRVSIVRALATTPLVLVILADEPPGQPDPRTVSQVRDRFFDRRERMEATLAVGSHARRLADRFDRRLFLEDGGLTDQPSIRPDQAALH